MSRQQATTARLCARGFFLLVTSLLLATPADAARSSLRFDTQLTPQPKAVQTDAPLPAGAWIVLTSPQAATEDASTGDLLARGVRGTKDTNYERCPETKKKKKKATPSKTKKKKKKKKR